MAGAKSRRRLKTGKVVRDVCLILLAAKGGYDVTVDYVIPAGNNATAVVQEWREDFAEMRDYESRLRNAPETYISIGSSADFDMDLEIEARSRGITKPGQVKAFVKRVYYLNFFKHPDGATPEDYGYILARDSTWYRHGSDPKPVEQRTVPLELTQGEDGRISCIMGNSSPTVAQSPEATAVYHEFEIRIPDINYNKGVAAARAENTNSSDIPNMGNQALGARRLSNASVPADSYAEVRPTRANNYAVR